MFRLPAALLHIAIWLTLALALPPMSLETYHETSLQPRQNQCSGRILATIPGNPCGPFTYLKYFHGRAITESFANPGNKNPVVTLLIDGGVQICDAAQQCVQAAKNQGGGYNSVDLHYRISTGMYQCVMFYGANRNVTFWNVADADVGEAYGYSM